MNNTNQDSRNHSSFRNFCVAPSQKKILFFIIVLLVLFYTCTGRKDQNFDYFIFSQRWLTTSCIAFEEKSTGSHQKCVLVSSYDNWAIHGLWPTKYGTKGPFFCNQSMPFNENALEPIKNDLETFWPNIESGESESSLWKHEWKKHGTCAAQIEAFDEEFKYFNKTLGFFKQYNINEIFGKNGVKASDTQGYDVVDLFLIVKNTYGKNPYLNCVFERNLKKQLLAEIRICFDKNLELMDCEEVSKSSLYFSSSVTNCPLQTSVLIPKTVDGFSPENNKKQTFDTLLEILNVVKFLQWSFL